jgi:ATP/ADP translocase
VVSSAPAASEDSEGEQSQRAWLTARLLARLGVQPGERRVFAWSAAAFFLIGWASVSLANVADTLFLKRIGVQYLPAVFLASSLLLAGTTAAVARAAARTAPLILATRTFLVLGASLLPLWLLVRADLRGALVLLAFVAKQFDAVAVMVFWVALGSRLHGRQAKRLYAPIVAGGTLGEMLGSFASSSIGLRLGIAAPVLVAAAAFVLAGLIGVRLRAVTRVRPALVGDAARARRGRRAAPTMRSLWRQSRLFRLLVVSALLSGMLGPMLYFQFSYVADLATQGARGEQRLLNLYAAFRGFLNAGILALQLAGTSWLFRRIGVPLAATLSPLVYLLGFAGVSLRLGLPAAASAMAGATLQDHAVYDPAQKILVTLFPERVRAAATSLIEGPVQRFGGALGNAVILAALAFGAPAWAGLAGLPFAAVWLAVTVVLWRVYPALLLEVASARRGHLDEALRVPELVNQSTLRALETWLVDPDPQRCRAAGALVAELPAARAVRVLARAVRRAPAANRTIAIDALRRVLGANQAHGGLWIPEVSRQLEALLLEGGLRVAVERARLVQAYAHLAPDLRPRSHAARVLARFLDDPAECVRLAATARIHGAGAVPGAESDFDAMLAAALASEDAAVREVALEEVRAALLRANGAGPLGSDGEHFDARVALLAAALQTPCDRQRAAGALADVAARHGARLAAAGEALLAHADDPDPRVRAAALRFIGSARLEQQLGRAVARLDADDETEAAAAHAALRAFGTAALAPLLEALRCGTRKTRNAVLAVLREVPVEPAVLRALLQRELDAIWSVVLQFQGLRAGPVSGVVLQRLAERIDEGLQTALLLLAALLREERIAVIGRLLPRAGGPRQRALLLEALEALLPPEERASFQPLLEDVSSPRLAAAAAGAIGRAVPAFDEALRSALTGDDALTRAFLRATLDEALLARAVAASDAEAPAALADCPQLGHDGEGESPGEHQMLSRMEIVLHLRSLELFAGLTTRQLRQLADVVREERHATGATIIREGDFEDCMYLVVSGMVSVTRENRFLAHTGPGGFFGEMSLFDGETRAATVTAENPVYLLRLERHDLFQVMDEQPGIAIAICQTLSRRMRNLLAQQDRARDEGAPPARKNQAAG